MKYLPGLLCLFLLMSCTSNESNQGMIEGDFSNQLTQEEINAARLTPEILWKYGRVADMQLSPDGSKVLYTLTRFDAVTDKKHTWIYLISSKGGETANLTEGIASSTNPRWINNEQIAFLCKANNYAQIWSMNANGSNKKEISAVESDIGGFGVAPDGRHLFYLVDVKLDSTTQDRHPDLPLAKGMVIDDLMYRHWDSWHDNKYSHIFISSIENGKVQAGKDIMGDEHFDSPLPPYFDIEDITWNHDGSLLAYTSKKLRGKNFAVSTNSDIYIYNVSEGTTTNITKGMLGYDRYPVFSADGKKLAFMSMETPGYESDKERLFVYDLGSKTRTYLTGQFDQNSTRFVWAGNNDKIIFISGVNATYQIFEISVESMSIRQITKGAHDYESIALKNGVITATKQSMSVPPEIFRVDPESGSEVQLTFTNKNIYDAIEIGKVEEKWVKTTDGKEMLVWVVLPPGFDSTVKYPALLYCQGGPQSAVSQGFSYRWNLQLMAANGYVIIAPNRRGLPTFGEEWNEQISGDYGGQNIRDYLSAVDALKTESYIDGDRIGAVGASYGGFSVLYLAGHHNNRFKAFIAHCGMFNLESQSAGTEEMFFVHHDLGGYYWDKPKPKSYTQFSPHIYVDKWDTPIMLVTGMNDFRIPYTESLQAFNVAQLRGIPSKLLVYPDENHWVTKPQNSILWQREFFSWLDQWLK